MDKGIDGHQRETSESASEVNTFIEMFAGIGGFRLGLEPLGLRCLWANDADPAACAVYRSRHGQVSEGNIEGIPSSEIPDHDMLTAGFPCQSFSRAGANLGFEDTRGTLFFEVARVLRDKQPKVAVLENVRDILTHDKGRTFRTVASTIRECGYLLDYAVLNSADFGVAQRRQRVYIICSLMSACSLSAPPQQQVRRTLATTVQPQNKIIIPPAVDAAVRRKLSERPESLVRIRDVRTGFQSIPTWTVGLFGKVDDKDTLALEAMRRGHQAVMWDAMAGKDKPGRTWIRTFWPGDVDSDWRRMERLADMGYIRRKEKGGYSLINRNILPGGLPAVYGGPAATAPTLTASNMNHFGLVLEDGVYALGATEFEAIQGFPLGFTDIGTLTDRERMKLLGNAVTPQVARHAAISLLGAIGR